MATRAEPPTVAPARKPAAGPTWFENRPSEGFIPRMNLRELWLYRRLGWQLAVRDLKVRYKQTVFGVLWAIIQPLVAVIIFSIFFGQLADVPSDGLPYPVFAYAGLTVWFYFSTALDAAARSLVDNRALVTKVYFPRLLAPFSATLPGLVDLAISCVVLGVLMVIYGVAPDAALLTLPLWIVALLAVAVGAGLWLAALNALYRDVRYALAFGIQLWLYASPVVFPSSLVEGGWQYVFALNPLVGVIDGFRWATIQGPAPGPEDLLSLAVALVLVVSGAIYLRRTESVLADRI
jgi:lipopolysaccharide transport system permease protein